MSIQKRNPKAVMIEDPAVRMSVLVERRQFRIVDPPCFFPVIDWQITDCDVWGWRLGERFDTALIFPASQVSCHSTDSIEFTWQPSSVYRVTWSVLPGFCTVRSGGPSTAHDKIITPARNRNRSHALR
jgi:hypothetical protein